MFCWVIGLLKNIIEFKNIKKSFVNKQIYDGFNLSIKENETITILGKSGVGKSLILKLLIGLEKIDSGEIIYNGENISKYRESKYLKIRTEIAMLFQKGALFDSITVKDNLAYPLRMRTKLREKEIEKIVIEKLEMLSISETLNLMPSELSLGMQKRVALARALTLNPKVILYDEPTAALDPINVTLINNMIQMLQKEFGITSLIVTHDIDSAFKVSDRISFLLDKKILCTGTVKEIKESKDIRIYNFINGIVE